MATDCEFHRLPTDEHDNIESEKFFRRVVRSESSDEEILIGYNNGVRSNEEQLQNQLDVLEREKRETERKNEVLTHTLENERQASFNEARLSKQSITKVKEDLKRVEAEKQDALTRLSAMMSTKLRDNNPNIADLSDQFRPTKLAEMFSELYDNEWTDAFTAVNSVLKERQTVTFLLDILMDAYFFCSQELDNSWRMVCDWYLDDSLPNEQQIKKLLKDSRKVVVVRMTQRIMERYKDNLESVCNIQMLHAMLSTEVVEKYVLQSVKLCLLMCANDPPVVIYCSDRLATEPANSIQHDAATIASGKVAQSIGVISPKETHFVQATIEQQQLGKGEFSKKYFKHNLEDTNNDNQLKIVGHSIYAENYDTDDKRILRGELNLDVMQTNQVILEIESISAEHGHFKRILFDRNMFKEYTTRGPYLEYVVWPVMYLHQGGPMLGKGVAQGTKEAVCSGEEEQWTWKKVE